MRNFFAIVFIVFSIILPSCNNPLDKTYSAATYNDDMQTILQSSKVSEDDIDVLTKYIALCQVAGNDLQGKTYDEILSKIKNIQKATGDNTNQLKIDKETKRTRLNPYLSVKLQAKEFSNIKGKYSLSYTVLFQNKSAQNIKMVIGDISMDDVLEREIKKLDIVLDEEIKANSSLQKLYVVNYNHADENDKRIRTKALNDLRIEWNPEKIIFDDGHVED